MSLEDVLPDAGENLALEPVEDLEAERRSMGLQRQSRLVRPDDSHLSEALLWELRQPVGEAAVEIQAPVVAEED